MNKKIFNKEKDKHLIKEINFLSKHNIYNNFFKEFLTLYYNYLDLSIKYGYNYKNEITLYRNMKLFRNELKKLYKHIENY